MISEAVGSIAVVNQDMAESMERENVPFVCPECKKPGTLDKCRRFLLSFCDGKVSVSLDGMKRTF